MAVIDTNSMDTAFQTELQDVEEQLLAAIASNDPVLLLNHWTDLYTRFHRAVKNGYLSEVTISQCATLAERIASVSSNLSAQATEGVSTRQAVLVEARQYLAPAQTQAFTSTATHTPFTNAQLLSGTQPSFTTSPPAQSDLASFAPYRLFFLSHFTHPYPSPSQKETLLAQVTSHTSAQLSTWFVNARRRSGWQELLRIYCGGNKNEMIALQKRMRGGNGMGAWEVSTELKEAWEGVIGYFEDGGRDRVESGIKDVIDAGLLADRSTSNQGKGATLSFSKQEESGIQQSYHSGNIPVYPNSSTNSRSSGVVGSGGNEYYSTIVEHPFSSSGASGAVVDGLMMHRTMGY